jgi:hypothetical protein
MNYQNIYNQIIEQAKNKNRKKKEGIYYESHHIIPKCIGGEGKTHQWNSHPNIILLTPKEHFICHQLLCEIYPNENKLKYALWSMCNGSSSEKRQYIVSSRIYERMKHIQSNLKKLESTGKKHSDETIYLMRIKKLGKKQSEEHIQKRFDKLRGLKRSDITIKKMKKSASKPKPHLQKSINQYDLKGNFIKEWSSITEAALSLGKKNSNICECCKGKKQTAHGYKWSYKK